MNPASPALKQPKHHPYASETACSSAHVDIAPARGLGFRAFGGLRWAPEDSLANVFDLTGRPLLQGMLSRNVVARCLNNTVGGRFWVLEGASAKSCVIPAKLAAAVIVLDEGFGDGLGEDRQDSFGGASLKSYVHVFHFFFFFLGGGGGGGRLEILRRTWQHPAKSMFNTRGGRSSRQGTEVALL